MPGAVFQDWCAASTPPAKLLQLHPEWWSEGNGSSFGMQPMPPHCCHASNQFMYKGCRQEFQPLSEKPVPRYIGPGSGTTDSQLMRDALSRRKLLIIGDSVFKQVLPCIGPRCDSCRSLL